jgi:hypothetical protein
MTGTPDLIRQLAAAAEPVRRLHPPLVRAGLWIIVGTSILTAVAIAIGLRPDLGSKLKDPAFLIEIASAALTGITAAIAAFHVSLPDRNARWALLPLPALLVWLSTVGYGCLTNWVALGPAGPVPALSIPCLETIALGSTPLAVILYFMLRHARFVRPVATASVAALAVAGLTVSALRLFHELDATVLVLIWNVGAAAAIAAAGALFGRRLSATAR